MIFSGGSPDMCWWWCLAFCSWKTWQTNKMFHHNWNTWSWGWSKNIMTGHVSAEFGWDLATVSNNIWIIVEKCKASSSSVNAENNSLRQGGGREVVCDAKLFVRNETKAGNLDQAIQTIQSRSSININDPNINAAGKKQRDEEHEGWRCRVSCHGS